MERTLKLFFVLFFLLICRDSCQIVRVSDSSASEISGANSPLRKVAEEQQVISGSLQKKRYKDGEIVVKFKDIVDDGTIVSVTERMQAKIKRRISVSEKVFLLEIPIGSQAAIEAEKFGLLDEVEYAEPNYIYESKRMSGVGK